jgi:hypothetical protein
MEVAFRKNILHSSLEENWRFLPVSSGNLINALGQRLV